MVVSPLLRANITPHALGLPPLGRLHRAQRTTSTRITHPPRPPRPHRPYVRDEARVARSGRLRDLTQGTVSALSLGTRHDAQSRMDRTTTSRLLLAVRASARGNFLPRSCHSGTRHDPAAFQGGLAQGGRCRRPWLPAGSVLRHPVTPQMSKLEIAFPTPPPTRSVTRRPQPMSATATWRDLRNQLGCPVPAVERRGRRDRTKRARRPWGRTQEEGGCTVVVHGLGRAPSLGGRAVR